MTGNTKNGEADGDMNATRSVVWISGASSGIGAALALSMPIPDARLIGIARRPPAAGEHLPADLSDPTEWAGVQRSFDELIGSGERDRAFFLHFAGDGAPSGRASEADSFHYARSVQLNAASGPVLGQAFLRTCARFGARAVLVMCSSPGALAEHRGMAHYGAAKAGLLHWTQVVRAEEPESIVLAVIPWATDTPMLRYALQQDAATNPLSGEMRAMVQRGELQPASPQEVAAAVWAAVVEGAPRSPLHVGPRPPEFQ